LRPIVLEEHILVSQLVRDKTFKETCKNESQRKGNRQGGRDDWGRWMHVEGKCMRTALSLGSWITYLKGRRKDIDEVNRI
jgi:hypothetical protein